MSHRRRTYTTVTDEASLRDWVDTILAQGYCAFDTETTGLDSHSCDLVGLVFATSASDACYVPLTHVLTSDDGDLEQLPISIALKIVKPILEHPFVIKVMQNAKYDMNVMSRYGVDLTNIKDTMLMSLAMNAGKHRHGMDELSKIYLKHQPIRFSEVTGKGPNKVTFDYVPLEPATNYAAEDGALTLELCELFDRTFDPKARRIYTEIELPLVPVLAKMEQTGVAIDKDYFLDLSEHFESRARSALQKCIDAAGVEFNPGSPQQLGHVLYERLKLKVTERTASGKPATGADVLEGFETNPEISEDARRVIKSVLDYRAFRKLQSTYCDGLVEAINSRTGRVHPSFLQHGTQTGRFSCSDPNLQNIPIRTDDGKKIRAGFIARPGHQLIAADYSQIELRILAHIADEQSMKQAFAEGQDIHALTAAKANRVPIDDVTSDQRRAAKAINFGIPYGSTAYGMAKQNGLDLNLAEKLYDDYFRQYPGVATYMKFTKRFAREHGYVESMMGRRIWLPKIRSAHGPTRRHAERQAINAPIQGTAADIMKYAMLDVANMLLEERFETKMLLTVHDELLFEAPDDEVRHVMPLIVETMQSAFELDVPLLVEAKAATNWLEAH